VQHSFTTLVYYRAGAELHAALQTAFTSPPSRVGSESLAMYCYAEDFPYAGGGRHEFAALFNRLYASRERDDQYS
jgi:hypothetical protein